MRPYDPNLPLVSIHIPKTAGASLMRVLRGWFGDKLQLHYPMSDRRKGKPVLGPGTCIHGHFPRHFGFGLEDRVPGQVQYITFLRNPLEMMISNYNYKLKMGQKPPPVDKFFMERGCYMLQHLPAGINETNYNRILEDFVFVGVTEDLDDDIERLAKVLGKPAPEKVPHVNKSKRRQEPSDSVKRNWVERHDLEFNIWWYALATHHVVAEYYVPGRRQRSTV